MKTMRVLAMCALLSLATEGAAKDDSPDPNTTPEKKICRTETATGSLLRKKRTCMTQTDWDRLEQQTREDMRRFDSRQNRFTPTNPSQGVIGPPQS